MHVESISSPILFLLVGIALAFYVDQIIGFIRPADVKSGRARIPIFVGRVMGWLMIIVGLIALTTFSADAAEIA